MVLHTLTKKITSSWDGVIQRVQIFSEEVFLDLRNSVFPFINRVMFDQRKIYVLNVNQKNKNECEIHSKVIVSQDYFDY